MLTKNAKAVLRQANKTASGKITFEDLQKAVKLDADETERVCNHLIMKGYADSLRKHYTTGAGKAYGIALTEKGKHWKRIFVQSVMKVLILDVMLPVVSAVIAAIITTAFLN